MSDKAYALIKPPSKVVSIHKLKTQKEYADLLEVAQAKGLCVYSAEIQHKKGKVTVSQPWVLDKDTIKFVRETEKSEPKPAKPEPTPEIDPEPAQAPAQEKAEEKGLFCPYCSKPCNSTPGRTLHVKSKHPEHYEQYTKHNMG